MPITRDEILNEVDPAELIEYIDNATIHDQPKIDRSIGDLGYAQIITVDENNVILGGHGRRNYFLAAEKRIPHVQKVYGLTDEEKRALRLALNKIAGGTDLNKAKKEINFLAQMGYDLKYTGFNESELAAMIDKTSAAVSDSAAAIKERYADNFNSVPIRESRPDMYAGPDWKPDVPENCPHIEVGGNKLELIQDMQHENEPDSGLSWMVMVTLTTREAAENFLQSIGRPERFTPGRRQLHIAIDDKPQTT